MYVLNASTREWRGNDGQYCSCSLFLFKQTTVLYSIGIYFKTIIRNFVSSLTAHEAGICAQLDFVACLAKISMIQLPAASFRIDTVAVRARYDRDQLQCTMSMPLAMAPCIFNMQFLRHSIPSRISVCQHARNWFRQASPLPNQLTNLKCIQQGG